MNFRIAMQCRRAASSLCRPHEVIDQSFEYLLAERVSSTAEYILLAEAGPCNGTEAEAPETLKEQHVMIGKLVSRGPEPGNETFLLERHIPQMVRFRGMFLPSEGFLRLRRSSVGTILTGICRLTWADGQFANAADQTIARANSGGAEAVGCVQHLDASYIPWAREVLPHERSIITAEGVLR